MQPAFVALGDSVAADPAAPARLFAPLSPRHQRLLARATLLLPLVWLSIVAWQVTSVPAPTPLQMSQERRFGLDLDQRRAIALDFTAQAAVWRAASVKRFPKSRWSQEDHYYAFVFNHATTLATTHRLQLSEVMLIYDEAVRLGWRSRGEEPLAATTRSLQPRTR